jgi:tetratricopeptide (TPR) repeat protein
MLPTFETRLPRRLSQDGLNGIFAAQKRRQMSFWVLMAAFIFAGSCGLPASASAQTVELKPNLSRPDAQKAATAYERASQKNKMGEFEPALAECETGLASAPRDLPLRFLRSVLLQKLNRNAEALVAFESLTQEFPEIAEPHNNLAVIQAQMGDLTKAQASLERALRILPGYAVARENLGDVYLKLAQQAYEIAAKSDPKQVIVGKKLKATVDLINRTYP